MRLFHMVVEQTIRYQKRMQYDPAADAFVETPWDSLGYAKSVPYPYGWLKGYGAPPQRHLDVLLVSEGEYELGEVIAVRIVGVFLRNDGDNKLLALLPQRDETEYDQLPDGEKQLLRRLYPGKYSGEGWFGAEQADEVLRAHRARP